MSDQERDPDVAERLKDDPIDRIESEEADEDVGEAWEEADVDSGEAPTG